MISTKISNFAKIILFSLDSTLDERCDALDDIGFSPIIDGVPSSERFIDNDYSIKLDASKAGYVKAWFYDDDGDELGYECFDCKEGLERFLKRCVRIAKYNG